jgi:hypothetical protein
MARAATHVNASNGCLIAAIRHRPAWHVPLDRRSNFTPGQSRLLMRPLVLPNLTCWVKFCTYRRKSAGEFNEPKIEVTL